MSGSLNAAEIRALIGAQETLLTSTSAVAPGESRAQRSRGDRGALDEYLGRFAASLKGHADAIACGVYEVVRSSRAAHELAPGMGGFSQRSGALHMDDDGRDMKVIAQAMLAGEKITPSFHISLTTIDRQRGRGASSDLLPDLFGTEREDVWIAVLPMVARDRLRGIAVLIEPVGGLEASNRDELAALASMGAQAIALYRDQAARAVANRHIQQGGSDLTARAAQSLDAFWEADDRGRIGGLVPLSERFKVAVKERELRLIGLRTDQIKLSQPIEGHTTLAGLIATGRAFRDASIRITTPKGSVRLMLSGAPMDAEQADAHGRKGFGGALTLVDGAAPAERERRELLELVGRLERSRARERELRRESETLLEGLRILTKPIPSQNVFEGLLALLKGHLGFEGASLIRRHWQGHLVAAVATDAGLKAIDWKSVADKTHGLPEEPMLCDGNSPVLMALNEVDGDPVWNSAIIVRLAIENQPAWLVCLHSAPQFFSSYQLGLASRLALLTNQALANESDKNKAIQSSKLATLGEMATGIAHEMNQPLAAISLAAQNLDLILEEPTPDTEYARSKVGRIQAQTERASKIVNQMRIFARQSYDQSQLFRISEHIEGALGIVSEQLRNHGIEVTQSYPDNEPCVQGDPLQFEQVMLNLFSNARDAIDSHREKMREAGTLPDGWMGKLDISLSVYDETRVRLRVHDNGGGFPEDLKEQLFDPFFTTKQVGKGTGLGLSISYGIVRDMGGEIEAYNEGDGAVVELALNIAADDAGSSAA